MCAYMSIQCIKVLFLLCCNVFAFLHPIQILLKHTHCIYAVHCTCTVYVHVRDVYNNEQHYVQVSHSVYTSIVIKMN